KGCVLRHRPLHCRRHHLLGDICILRQARGHQPAVANRRSLVPEPHFRLWRHLADASREDVARPCSAKSYPVGSMKYRTDSSSPCSPLVKTEKTMQPIDLARVCPSRETGTRDAFHCGMTMKRRI